MIKLFIFRTYSGIMKPSGISIALILFAGLAQSLCGQTYFLNGSATELGNDCYQLTNAIPDQNGTVWYGDQIDLNQSFNLEFTMNFGLSDFGADGMVFVLQTVGTSAIGDDGEGIGFQGFAPSLGIEFDTYQNGNLGDLFEDHFAVIQNGDVNHFSPNNLFGPVSIPGQANIEDGLDHIVRIAWDAEELQLELWFDCELRLSGGVDLVNQIFNGENLVWWGFTAATGGETNVQSVCLQENILSVSEDVSICNGASIELNAAGNPNGSFEWTPATGLNDATIQTPIASPGVTTTYSVTYTDLCDNTITDEVTVNVTELELSGEVENLLTCYEPETTVSVENNFSEEVIYSWSTDDGEIISGENSSTISSSTPGIYTVNASFQEECFAETFFEIEADFFTFSAAIDPVPLIDCNNTSSTINAATDGEVVDIDWFTADGFILEGENSLSPTITDGGTYVLTITNPTNGCSSQDSVSVENIISFPTADAGMNDTIDCLNPFVVLNGGGSALGEEFDYLWSSADGEVPEEESNILNPQISVPGTYFLTVTNTENACTASDSLVVFLDESALVSPEMIQFPNIFTPNGDSINDVFRPITLDIANIDPLLLVDNYELRIFNRWGNLIYEATGNLRFWDGRLPDGSLPSPGVYFYTVKFDFTCGEMIEQERNGTVQIISD